MFDVTMATVDRPQQQRVNQSNNATMVAFDVTTGHWLSASLSTEATDGKRMASAFTVVANDGVINSSSTLPGNDDLMFGDLHLHPHWLQYRDIIESAPSWFLDLVGVYMTIICSLGIIGNLTVIGVFLRTQNLRTPSNYFVINLAFSDFTFSLINGFPLMSIACFKRRWMWGQAACEWYGFIAGIMGLNSIWSLAFIALDRYECISRPLQMLYKATSKRALLQILFIWFWAVAWTCPPMFGWSRYIGEGFQVSCTFDYLTRTPANIAFNYCLIGFGFLLPVTLTACCYIGIVVCVSRQAAEIMRVSETIAGKEGSKTLKDKQDRERREQEIRLTKIAAIMVSLFVISWLPYALVAQLGINGYNDFVTPYSCEIPVMLAKASAIWNPMVYSLTHPRYRNALRQISPCCKSILTKKQSLERSSSQSDSMSGRRQNHQSKTSSTPNVEMVTIEPRPATET